MIRSRGFGMRDGKLGPALAELNDCTRLGELFVSKVAGGTWGVGGGGMKSNASRLTLHLIGRRSVLKVCLLKTRAASAASIWRSIASARIFLLAIALFVSACTQLDRLSAVPANDTERASVAGIVQARFLPNDIAAMNAFGRELYARENAYLVSRGRPRTPEYSLAISGGGDNGAFGAGLLVGWSERGDRPSFKFVTGISTGALVAPLAFPGRECDPVLAEMYTTIEQANIFLKRPILAGLASDALADSTPLQSQIARYLDAGLVARIAEESGHGRALFIITTDLDAGVPVMCGISARLRRVGAPKLWN
jgi:hypothetical protein